MKSIEELVNEGQINESLIYDEIIQKLNEAKENKLQPCCPECGDTSDIRPYLFNKGIIFKIFK